VIGWQHVTWSVVWRQLWKTLYYRTRLVCIYINGGMTTFISEGGWTCSDDRRHCMLLTTCKQNTRKSGDSKVQRRSEKCQGIKDKSGKYQRKVRERCLGLSHGNWWMVWQFHPEMTLKYCAFLSRSVIKPRKRIV